MASLCYPTHADVQGLLDMKYIASYSNIVSMKYIDVMIRAKRRYIMLRIAICDDDDEVKGFRLFVRCSGKVRNALFLVVGQRVVWI